MRLPRFRLRTLMVAVAVTGLVVGNYARMMRQLDGRHSYGLPMPAWRVFLLSLVGDAMALAFVGVVAILGVIGWKFARRPGPRT
jgi:hypothetical protein